MTKIAVIGLGNVGLSNAVLLARRYSVVAMDIQEKRVALVNSRSCTDGETLLADALGCSDLDLVATIDFAEAVQNAEFVLIATQTNLDLTTNQLDTHAMEATIEAALAANPNTVVVIRSTIPIGFVEKCRSAFCSDRIIFCPEFLRQDYAYYDCLHPTRIVVGDQSKPAAKFARLLARCSADSEVPILLTTPREAEAIKLFSNAYLAMRVSFFNELDSFAMLHGIDTAQIITGVGLDPRIGQHYNTPSMGYGGNCLPKDTKQLLANFADVPQNLIKAVVESNQTRIDFLVDSILLLAPTIVGIYCPDRTGDKWQNSPELGMIRGLIKHDVSIILYDPSLKNCDIPQTRVVQDLNEFKAKVDLILCDRHVTELQDVAHKIWTRDFKIPLGHGVL